MQKLLLESDKINIQYVALTLWHNGYKNGLLITDDYDYTQVDRIFQLYNPGNEGYGNRVSSYALKFYDYYGALGR